jgi:2-dehydro-3-deoxyphosphogluconate aldolase/(4S)-4-hydroxy-2-oxoglutarate aldolase
MANALVAAGINLIEFTTTTPGALNLVEEFAANKSLNVGLGTALNKDHVNAAKKAGAQFVISPHTDEEVIKATKAADLISIPGVASPTDIGNAIKYGADALKFFPASSLGPNYLKAVREPFPGQIWMATGGISVESIDDWMRAGCTAVGIGSPLTSGGLNEIPARVKAFQDAIKAAK